MLVSLKLEAIKDCELIENLVMGRLIEEAAICYYF